MDYLNMQEFYLKIRNLIEKLLKNVFLVLIKSYKLIFSGPNSLLGFLGLARKRHCPFYPTCSQYAEEALKKHSFFKAMGLILYRLVRCHPFREPTIDPVP